MDAAPDAAASDTTLQTATTPAPEDADASTSGPPTIGGPIGERIERNVMRLREDPRLYARAYHALVPRGESELAAGVSVRPIVEVPVRVAGEPGYGQ